MTENERKSIDILCKLAAMPQDRYTRAKDGILAAAENMSTAAQVWINSLFKLADSMRAQA